MVNYIITYLFVGVVLTAIFDLLSYLIEKDPDYKGDISEIKFNTIECISSIIIWPWLLILILKERFK